jgi:sterol desaturase/sphingolipid hydroxylase (fatty acid hydroxylase superfamily)
MQSLTAFITPALVGLIAVESWCSMKTNLEDQKIKDATSNIIIGITSSLSEFLVKGISILILVQCQYLSPFNFGTSVFTWIILFLLSDLFFYCFHYLEHHNRLLWANHSVHHSSSFFNLSVGFRLTLCNNFYRLLFEIPLCLLGFDVKMVVILNTVMMVYGFFQHTECIGKLGWFEHIFNTPSHHRVHHSSEEKYLDKNFGLVLIIWDKLFGTFKEEEDKKPVYGLTRPVTCTNLYRILFHEWIYLSKDLRKAKTFYEIFGYLLFAPAWKPMKVHKRKAYCFLITRVYLKLKTIRKDAAAWLHKGSCLLPRKHSGYQTLSPSGCLSFHHRSSAGQDKFPCLRSP